MARLNGSAVVTGAGRGLGKAVALELAKMGYPVGLQARTQAQLYDTRAEVEALGGRARVVPGDATRGSDMRELIERSELDLGPVAVAAACAGRFHFSPLLDTSPDDFHELLQVNVIAAFNLVQAAGSAMIRRRAPGRIILIAGAAAVRGMKGAPAYTASMHALLGLVRSCALELAPLGITVNALCPGWIRSRIFDSLARRSAEELSCSEEEAAQKLLSSTPMNRLIEPSEVSAALGYLASEEAAHVTGQAMLIDGGGTA